MNNWQLFFKDWLKTNRRLSDSSLDHYAGAIKSILSWTSLDVEDITSAHGFQIFKKAALENPTFTKRNAAGNNMYSVALGHFEEFVKMNIFTEPLIFPEVVSNEKLLEGSKKAIIVNSYERNPIARKRCIQHYGDTCIVCGFRFADFFGDDYEGVIHVHHLKPLSEITQEYVIDPLTDLIPVCPNCHLVIHSKADGTYTIAEAKDLLKRQQLKK